MINRNVQFAYPDVIAKVNNVCLNEGVYLQMGKLQRLMLLFKITKPSEDLVSYRLICMLDTAGK